MRFTFAQFLAPSCNGKGKLLMEIFILTTIGLRMYGAGNFFLRVASEIIFSRLREEKPRNWVIFKTVSKLTVVIANI